MFFVRWFQRKTKKQHLSKRERYELRNKLHLKLFGNVLWKYETFYVAILMPLRSFNAQKYIFVFFFWNYQLNNLPSQKTVNIQKIVKFSCFVASFRCWISKRMPVEHSGSVIVCFVCGRRLWMANVLQQLCLLPKSEGSEMALLKKTSRTIWQVPWRNCYVCPTCSFPMEEKHLKSNHQCRMKSQRKSTSFSFHQLFASAWCHTN